MFNSEVIGIVIKKQRKRHKISQEVLSGLAGLDRTHYSKIERNLRCPNLETIFKIAYAFEMKPHELVLLIEDESNRSCGNFFN